MIECPFCNESFEEDELVFEFNWGNVATYYYNRRKLPTEPSKEFKDRAFYVRLKYDARGNALLRTCSSVINQQKHPDLDPMCTERNGWSRIVRLLSEKKVFEVESDDEDSSLPVLAKILPLVKDGKKHKGRGVDVRLREAEGLSTGIFCPMCEQQLKAEVLKAETEVRILFAGRPGSGKTVYATQAISELLQGRLAQDFHIDAANQSVHEHYIANKNRLRVSSNGFVLATNPNAVQDPYVYLLHNDKSTIRLVLQDIAGEDTENRTKYSTAVRKADMILFFIDPWHIEEIRVMHEKNNDLCNEVVRHSTGGRYTDLSGVFLQMLNVIDRDFTLAHDQLAGVLMVKGDYLDPPMLASDEQPECQMMKRPIPFRNPTDMEFTMALRSSFIRQLMHEWESTRSFSREVESKYPAHNTRYFISTALGQSTHLRRSQQEDESERYAGEDPDAQFSMGDSSYSSSGSKDYDEQVLESVARPEHVIDPIFWCLKRKGVKF